MLEIKHCDRWPEYSFGCRARWANVPSLHTNAFSQLCVTDEAYYIPTPDRIRRTVEQTVNVRCLSIHICTKEAVACGLP